MSGGKGGGKPIELTSDSTIKLIDALCEGEIDGLVSGLQSVYYDQTPVQNADGSFNWKIVNFQLLPGIQYQSPLPGFDAVQSEVAVNQEIKNAIGPVTRTVVTPNLDAIKVTIAVPRLLRYDNDGNSQPTKIAWNIYLKIDNGAFIHQAYVEFDRKSTSGFESQTTVRIQSGYTNLQIRVERVTEDATSDKLSNQTILKSYTEVVETKLAYPNTAVVGTEISSDVVKGGVPARLYHIKATKVRVPSNATVNADGGITYAGVWDGTFSNPTWTADPAWCLYHLLQDERGGVGVSPEVLNPSKWDFYRASQWCNQEVSDGRGGVEPRFLLHVVIDQEYQAYELILLLASVFTGIFYLLGNGIGLSIDSPSNPVAVLTNENSTFNYSSGAYRHRKTVAIVQFSDPDNFGSPEYEVVTDRVGLAKYGYREHRLTAFGCASRSQAHRIGLWYLFTNRMQAQTLIAQTGIIGQRIKPGEIVYVANRLKTSYQAGKIRAATTSRITLDRLVTIEDGIVYDLVTINSDGVMDRRVCRTVGAEYINPVTPYLELPHSESIWILIPQTDDLQEYRVLSSIAKDNNQYELSLARHIPSKYTDIEADLVVGTGSRVSIPNPPNPPRLVVGSWEVIGGSYNLEIDWQYPIDSTGQPDAYTSGYQVQYRRTDTDAWQTLTTTARSLTITGVSSGEYLVQVAAVNIVGRLSVYVSTPVSVGVAINASTRFDLPDSSVFILHSHQ